LGRAGKKSKLLSITPHLQQKINVPLHIVLNQYFDGHTIKVNGDRKLNGVYYRSQESTMVYDYIPAISPILTDSD